MKRKLLRAFGILPWLTCLALPGALQAQFDFATNNGTLTIMSYTGPGGDVVIPSEAYKLPVTVIGAAAFASGTSLTSVTIPDAVTNIGNWAFAYCTSLTNVTIPKSVTSIGDWAFYTCTNLTSVMIPENTASIGDSAFEGCTSMRAITVDPLNLAYSSVDGVLFDKDQTTLIQFPVGRAGSYTIPGTVHSIWELAFEYCRLTSVTIPNSVTTIRYGALSDSASLTSVTIPDSVTNISTYAFSECISLTNVTIPNSITTIKEATFNQCGSLTAVTLPDSVTTLGPSAFANCTNLSTVALPSRLTTIGPGAFEACVSLTNVTIPESVTNIRGWAFEDCTSLTALYFKGNAPSVGRNLLSGDYEAIVYYLPGTTGWDTAFWDSPTAWWWLPQPTILSCGVSFGGQTNGFGFIISWATNASVVVEACTNLANPNWSALATNALTDGCTYFGDPGWTNHSIRLYRARSP